MRSVWLICLLLAGTAPAQTTKSADSQITVRSIRTYDSAGRLSSTQEQEIVASIVGKSYGPGGLDEISERVRYACQVYGFFKVEVGPAVVVSSQSSPQENAVDLTISVNVGEQYRIAQLLFTGAKAFPASELRPRFEIQDGDVFNVETIRKGLEALRQLYAKQGYINFVPVPNTVADDQAHTVALTIDLDEGKQFRVGKLIVNGDEAPEPPCKAQLLQDWKWSESQIYDPDILTRFLNDHSAIGARGVNPENGSEIISHASTGTVDVTVEIPDDASCASKGRW